ncbi:MAG TPA: cytochrome c biogenesis protein CcdA [Blastocatellia bacterium]|jgi:thiol:disulfide interchange protein DsbD|nr:cytochrome c biogenesis protein CcdA [Blastocatellia bacterium]
MSGFASDLRECLSAGSLMAYPIAFGAGLLISFTPCVYPIIPIQLGFIGGQTASARAGAQAGGRGSLRGFTLSVLFVTGMAIVYAALGAFASLTGALFGSWASSPWTYIVVGNVILLMALSMLDVIRLPALPCLTGWNPRRKGNGYISALMIGASSGLLVGPCTAPALGATLAYVGARGNLIFGTTVLFVFAIGMGALMIALGAAGGALTALPRSGEWMVKIKKGFGFAMILTAQYLFIQAGQRFI